jgi:hypothetical protein
VSGKGFVFAAGLWDVCERIAGVLKDDSAATKSFDLLTVVKGHI